MRGKWNCIWRKSPRFASWRRESVGTACLINALLVHLYFVEMSGYKEMNRVLFPKIIFETIFKKVFVCLSTTGEGVSLTLQVYRTWGWHRWNCPWFCAKGWRKWSSLRSLSTFAPLWDTLPHCLICPRHSLHESLTIKCSHTCAAFDPQRSTLHQHSIQYYSMQIISNSVMQIIR